MVAMEMRERQWGTTFSFEAPYSKGIFAPALEEGRMNTSPYVKTQCLSPYTYVAWFPAFTNFFIYWPITSLDLIT